MQQIRAATAYDDPVATVIKKFKYDGYFALAEPLASLMAAAWARHEVFIDTIIPVPLHPSRRRERGFNQAELLVKQFSELIGISASTKALSRIRRTIPQVGLDFDEREANVAGAFAANKEMVAGRRILLVDDVCTTGSTLVAASVALIAAGALEVSGYCLAHAV